MKEFCYTEKCVTYRKILSRLGRGSVLLYVQAKKYRIVVSVNTIVLLKSQMFSKCLPASFLDLPFYLETVFQLTASQINQALAVIVSPFLLLPVLSIFKKLSRN